MQRQLFNVTFGGGVDTKTDPKQVVSAKLLSLENGVFQRAGEISKRWGYTALGQQQIGAGAPISACRAINVFNNELLLYDGSAAYSYIPAVNSWASRGKLVSVIQTNQSIVRNTSQQVAADHARVSGIDVYAWLDSRGGIRYSVVDSASGTNIMSDALLAANGAGYIRCVAMPLVPSIVVFYQDTYSNIWAAVIRPSSPAAAPVSFLVASDAFPGFGYDVSACALTSTFFLSYSQTASSSGIGFWNFLSCLLSASTFMRIGSVSLLNSGLSGPNRVSTCVDSNDQLFGALTTFASGVGTNIYVFAANASDSNLTYTQLASLIPQASPSLGIVSTGPNAATVFFELSTGLVSNPSTNYVVSCGITNSGGGSTPVRTDGLSLVTPATLLRGVGLASEPFSYNGAVYVNVATQTQQQSTYFTVDASGSVVAKALAGLGGGLPSSVAGALLPTCQQVASGVFQYANLVKSTFNTEAGLVLSLTGVNRTQLDFAHSNLFLSRDINGILYTVGGILQSYDGATYVEHGFHMYPEAYTAVSSATGGFMGTPGLTSTYYYSVLYAWTDNMGGVQYSTPGIPLSVSMSGTSTGSVTLTIPTLRLTAKPNVRIEIYRTTNAGTILYRVSSAVVPTFSLPGQDTVTFIDTLADASITSNGAMYTQPLTVGSNPIVPNTAPPSCSLITVFANRLVLAGVDDPYSIWYSQQVVSATNGPSIPAQFGNLFTYKVDPDGGPITAIVRLDDKLVIFKASGIYYLTGQGPTATGDQNDFGVPVQVQTANVGSINPNSIVQLPVGVIFQSKNGIYLLDRALNCTYIGAPVEAYNAMVINSATVVPNNWVVFTSLTGIADPYTGNTVNALVYDYYFDQWSTFTNHSAVDSDLYFGAGNLLVYANANGTVFQQTHAAFSDNGTPIQLDVTTSYLTPQIEGYQRIYHAFLLGTYRGSHTLNVQAAFDYDGSPSALAVIPSDANLGISTFGSDASFGSSPQFGGSPGTSVYQYRLDILRKCQAVSFRIFETESSPGNEALRLSAMVLDVGVKRGGFKLPARRQFGMG